MPDRPPVLIPTALSHGETAERMIEAGRALRLAGGPVAFATVEIRHMDATRAYLPAVEFAEDASLAPLLERLTAPRPPLAGLSLDRPRVMGIVNVTPDSFSDGGDHLDAGAAIAHGRAQLAAGADILDIGGESTRPGAAKITTRQEIDRVLPVVQGLRDAGALISIDSRNAETLRAAADAGAAILNDVSALAHDDATAPLAAELGLPIILMHMRGTPDVMMDHAVYDDVTAEVCEELSRTLDRAQAAGIDRARMLVDPGFGFAKATTQNSDLLNELAALHGLGVPVVVGASRKTFLGAITAQSRPKDRLGASLAAALAGVARGAQIVRVHDVAETVQAIAAWSEINAIDRKS